MSIDHGDLYSRHANEIAHANETGHRGPTQDELVELAALEPSIEFRVARDVNLSDGRQSRVSVLEYDSDDATYRVIWKRMGAGKGPTYEGMARGVTRVLRRRY